MSRLNPRLVVLTLLALVVALVGIFGLRHRTSEASTPAPAPRAAGPSSPDAISFPEGAAQLTQIRSQPMLASGVPLADALGARITYDEEVTARLFPPVSGRITALLAEPGDKVRAGQVLARIDAPDFGTARADLDKARADESRKRLAFERAQALGAGEGIAVKDLEIARADFEAAKAEALRAQERIRNLNPRGLPLEGQQIAVTSPVSGIVSERNATPALEVSPGAQNPLFVVTDPKRLWLLIDVPERLFPLVKAGTPVAVESDAWPGVQFAARVVQLGPVVDPNTRRVVARARLDNAQGKLLPEMFVRASLLQDAGRGIRVPNSAIVTRGLNPNVFVETRPGRFERRQVTLSMRGVDASFVVSGLESGERVVTAGALLLDAQMGSGQRQ